MSVIIRLQNLPWSANALDIRNFFRGLSIPEGGVHIVGGELGDAFIAFSTDEDARQAMMLDGGKIKEIQVKLLLSSRSEMHKVIETARQSVPILSLAPPAPTPAPVPPVVPAPTPVQAPAPTILPVITPFSTALGGNTLTGFGIPGLGNPQEIPQPAVIEPPAPLISPSAIINPKEEWDEDKEEEKSDKRRSKEKDRRRTRSRSRSRDRERKERKRDRRDRSRSRERRRRDRSRSRDRRERKRDRKDRSRSRDRSPSRRSRDRRNERRSPGNSQEKIIENAPGDIATTPALPVYGNNMNAGSPNQMPSGLLNGPTKGNNDAILPRFNDPTIADAYNKLQELGKKRNPNAFQGDHTNGVNKAPGGRGDSARGGNTAGGFRREGRSRFDNDQQAGCCVAIRNAPNHTSYGDVRRFFPFLIDKHGIKMINDNMGRRTGNIYVRFCDSRSKNLALQRKLNELKGAQVVVEHLNDESYDSAVDSFLPFREDNDEEDVSLVIADTEVNSLEPFSVIKLADLPNFVKEHDIIKTFSDFSLLSIMLFDCRISRSKIAYVQFAKPEEAKLAYEAKDSYMFGRRQPTLTSVTNEEFEKEKKRNEKLSDMPRVAEKVTEESAAPRDPRQRRQQFETPSLQKTPLVQTPQQSGTFFSPPFVQQGFPQAAFNNTTQIGGYPPALGSIDPRTAAANWANRPQFPNPQNLFEKSNSPALGKRVMTTEMDEEPLDCVLMKGLPREATDRTIVTFLSDTGAVPARIHLMLDANGLPSGDCFCEFRSSQEARMAATKHGSNLDGCRITVDLVPRTVVEEALEGPKQPESLLNAGPPPQQYFEQARGGFGPRGPYRGRGSYDRGGFVRGGFEMGRGGYRGRGGYSERGGFNERGRGFERGRGRGRGFGHSRGFENGRDEEHDPALADFGAPGCVVSMENVPFRATIEEIMQFFSEFELTHDDVIRRYNERGQPTGDARVAFRTPFDAQRAVKTRHMDNIHDRRISLNII